MTAVFRRASCCTHQGLDTRPMFDGMSGHGGLDWCWAAQFDKWGAEVSETRAAADWFGAESPSPNLLSPWKQL